MIQAVHDWGGWMWVIIDVLAVAILGAGMAYGGFMWRRRPQDPATTRASDDATRELYHHRHP